MVRPRPAFGQPRCVFCTLRFQSLGAWAKFEHGSAFLEHGVRLPGRNIPRTSAAQIRRPQRFVSGRRSFSCGRLQCARSLCELGVGEWIKTLNISGTFEGGRQGVSE
jgi:hypothetical protein